MNIVVQTGAVLEQMSTDEAYVDVSALCQGEDADASLLRAIPLARQLKQRIRSERQLTATIGVAANKLLIRPGEARVTPAAVAGPWGSRLTGAKRAATGFVVGNCALVPQRQSGAQFRKRMSNELRK